MRLDNMNKNRRRIPHSILTEAEAQQILDAQIESEAIALGKKFKVGRQAVLKIRKRQSWKHLTPSRV